MQLQAESTTSLSLSHAFQWEPGASGEAESTTPSFYDDRDRAWATETVQYARKVLRSERVGFSIIDHGAGFVLRVGQGPGFFRANLESGVVIVLSGLSDHLSRRDRELLTRVAHYIETSYRVHRDPTLANGEVDLRSGQIVGAGGGLTLKDLWTALVTGRLSLIEVASSSTYLIVESSFHARALRALTQAEVAVVENAARGFSTKMIAYELGLSSPTVSTRLFHAASKVGATLRTDVVRLVAMSQREESGNQPSYESLTTAERDVLFLVRQGLSNEKIASLRARSIRTVANQVASLLKKTSSSSRRALAATT